MIRTAAIAAAVAAALAGGAAAGASAGAPQAPSSRADVSFSGVRLWVYQGSQLRSVGRATRVTYDRAAGVAQAGSPDADFLSKVPGGPPVHVTAGSAEGHAAARTLDARDGVTLRRQDGTAITQAAHYDAPSRHASGVDPVQVHTDRFDVSGQGGFALDTATQKLELLGPVQARGEVQP